MKQLLIEYAAYNQWAHKRLLEVIISLPEQDQKAGLPSSFKSLYHTALHMWDAESAWWQRVKLTERVILPSQDFTGSMEHISNGLMLLSQQWREWISSASDLSIAHVIAYQNSKKEQFKQPVYQVLHHVFNHSTYHRGQLVNMLRQLGIEKIPSTDFSMFSRGK